MYSVDCDLDYYFSEAQSTEKGELIIKLSYLIMYIIHSFD